VYRVSNTSTAIIFNGQSDLASAGGSSYGLLVGTTNSDVYTNNGGFGVTSPNPTVGQWAHIALARTGGTLSSYLNGTRVGTNSSLGTSIINNGATTYPPTVGMAANGLYPFTGYISGLRLIKGSGGYNATNATITIPTAPPTAVTNTSILLNFTNAGITDATAKNVFETIGTAQISTAQSKYGGASIYLNGSSNLAAADSVLQTIGSADFTLEMWVYPTTSGTVRVLLAHFSGTSGFSFELTAGNLLTLWLGNGSTSGYVITSAGTVAANQWAHVAAARSGTSLKLFINGVQDGSVTNSTVIADPSAVLSVGSTPTGTQPVTGYVSDVRITKGYARYVANFTPPTSLLQNQ